MVLIFSELAKHQLENIYDFLSQKNGLAAVNLYNEILDDIDRLLLFPQMAPIEPLLAEEPELYRSLVVCHYYKVIYFVEGEIINIVDVWDCRRNPIVLKQGTKKQK